METPLVTILTPTYNHGACIGACIASVQAQDYPHWEMLILNDGSTDTTEQNATSAAAGDKRIRILTQSNVGVFRLGETYNKGLQMARGKYIAILEGDDVWAPSKLRKQVEILEKDPSLVLTWGKAALINEDDTAVYRESPDPEKIPAHILGNTPPGVFIKICLFDAWIPALTLLIRKESLTSIGGFIQSHGMPLVDFPTILILSKTGPFHFQNEVIGKWRIYPTQTTKRYTTEIWEGVYAFVREHLAGLDVLQKQEKDQIRKHYLQQRFIGYARSGRYKLIRREYKGARTDYIKAIAHRPVGKELWRLRAIVGLLFSFFHIDVEGLARLMGKTSYTSKPDEG